jgi:quercetin dioxygenase-like cupin family protein
MSTGCATLEPLSISRAASGSALLSGETVDALQQTAEECRQILSMDWTAPTRSDISAFQTALAGSDIACELPEAEHFFASGMYARKFAMPAGMVVVGKEHRHQHFVIVISGNASISSEFGLQQVVGGDVFVSPPGSKRIVMAHEDTVFMTLHLNPSNTRDLSVIEDEHIVPDSLYLGIGHKEAES